MNKPALIIFTEGHPDTDTGFISPELNVLSHFFRQIIVYPLRWDNKPNAFKFPANVFLRSELADFLKSVSSGKKKIEGVFSLLFWTSVFRIRPSGYKSLLNTCGYIKIMARWIKALEFDKSCTIFYSYWLLSPALALYSLKKREDILYLVSRAHGIDLYDERGGYILNFFKPSIFQKLDKLYCVSEFGMKYLAEKYNNYSDKFMVSRLGTYNKHTILPPISGAPEFVSCSFLSQVKRIDLLIRGIKKLQIKFPEVQIKWTHIGGGPLFDSLFMLASQSLKPGTFNFIGTLSPQEIYVLYSSRTFDCLVNVSESEGLPVSIMEAQSFGIPVIASAVGGTPEIVNNENGYLLPANPSPDEIASAIYDAVINHEKWDTKRGLSRKNWQEKFDAEKNYLEFAHELLSVLESKVYESY